MNAYCWSLLIVCEGCLARNACAAKNANMHPFFKNGTRWFNIDMVLRNHVELRSNHWKCSLHPTCLMEVLRRMHSTREEFLNTSLMLKGSPMLVQWLNALTHHSNLNYIFKFKCNTVDLFEIRVGKTVQLSIVHLRMRLSLHFQM